jgi:hypothetical protein
MRAVSAGRQPQYLSQGLRRKRRSEGGGKSPRPQPTGYFPQFPPTYIQGLTCISSYYLQRFLRKVVAGQRLGRLRLRHDGREFPPHSFVEVVLP